MEDDIEVTFTDAATDQPFQRAFVAANLLPETFALETTLHVGELEWVVESASPMTRAEYSRSKKLELRLRKVVRVDPKDILYSLSTIENALPAASDDPANAAPATSDDLVIHEDDWRQLELISRAHEELIDEELDAIGEIHVNYRAGAGFKKLHVRAKIPQPIVPGSLRIENIGELSARRPTFRGTGSCIRDGFVVELGPHAAFYGIASEGDVRVLCVRVEGAVDDEALKTLERIQKDHQLIFVDWCSCRTGMRAFFQE